MLTGLSECFSFHNSRTYRNDASAYHHRAVFAVSGDVSVYAYQDLTRRDHVSSLIEMELGLLSRDASIIPAMAVVAAVCHIAIGPIISRSFHVPGPTVAGPVIMAPIMVAGAVTQRRGTLVLTSAINGLILSLFVPIGLLAFPIYIVVGLVLELFYAKSSNRLSSPPYSFLAGGVSNALSILLIAIVALSMKATILLAIIGIIGFVSGGIGGLIASGVMFRVRHMYPAKSQ